MREITANEIVVELRTADGVEHRPGMTEPVGASAPDVEFDRVEPEGAQRIQSVNKGGSGLRRHASRARLHTRGPGAIDLQHAQAASQRRRGGIRTAGPGPDDDQVEVLHIIRDRKWRAKGDRSAAWRAGL